MSRRCITAEEHDVHTGWRAVLCSYRRAGKAKAVKRRSNRRERREGHDDVAERVTQALDDAAETGGWFM